MLSGGAAAAQPQTQPSVDAYIGGSTQRIQGYIPGSSDSSESLANSSDNPTAGSQLTAGSTDMGSSPLAGSFHGRYNGADNPNAAPRVTSTDIAPTPTSGTGPELVTPQALLDAALTCHGDLAGAELDPVLLVHGTTSTAQATWSWTYPPAFIADGRPVCTVDLPASGVGDIQIAAEYVTHAIRAMHAEAGREIDVIGHSQGGMVPRWSLKWWPYTRGFLPVGEPGGGAVRNVVVQDHCALSPVEHFSAIMSNAMYQVTVDALDREGPTDYRGSAAAGAGGGGSARLSTDQCGRLMPGVDPATLPRDVVMGGAQSVIAMFGAPSAPSSPDNDANRSALSSPSSEGSGGSSTGDRAESEADELRGFLTCDLAVSVSREGLALGLGVFARRKCRESAGGAAIL